MEGKLRKRSFSVNCPKPQERRKWEKAKLGFTPIDYTRSAGSISMKKCELCEYLEEFDLENNGVFCLWKKP